MRDQGQPLFNVRDLVVEYASDEGTVRAVRGVDFDVRVGEVVGIVGESGSGKSTLVNASIDLVDFPAKIIRGSAVLDGAGDLLRFRRRDLRRLRGAEIGYIAQNPFGSLNPILKIQQQFSNILRAHRNKSSSSDDRQVARAALTAVGIREPDLVLDGWAHQLSGGMAQRVVIAMASLMSPRLIIADEPTTALDVTVQRQILDLLSRLLVSASSGVVLVTHDLGIVAQYCNRVYVMYAGEIVESGPVRSVLRAPAHPYTRALLAAIPRPGTTLVRLRGNPPNLIQPIAGCPFAPRCEFAFVDCSTHPDLRPLDSTQVYACHLEGGVTSHAIGPTRSS